MSSVQSSTSRVRGLSKKGAGKKGERKDPRRYDLNHRYGQWGDCVESETRSVLEDLPESKGMLKDYLVYMIERLCKDTGTFGRLLAEGKIGRGTEDQEVKS